MSDAFATSPGAYVLGALAPDERAAFEEHLRTCADCREQVDELAGIPGLLARVPADAVERLVQDVEGVAVPRLPGGAASAGRGAAGPARAPAELLPALLRAAARQRRGRRRAWALGGGGLLAAAVAGLLVLAVSTGGSGGSTRSTVPARPGPSATAESTMTPVGEVPVRATVSLRRARWGTSVHLDCLYQEAVGTGTAPGPAPGAAAPERAVTYTLVVVDRAGARQGISTWTAVPGHDVQLDAATSLSRSAISAVQIRLGTDPVAGREVLELDTTS